MLQCADTYRCCAHCGRGFAAVRDDKQYCGSSCKQKAARKRRHNGVRHSLVGGLPDPVLEQLLDAMVFYRLLSEGETMDQTRVRSRTQRPRSSPTGVVVGALAHARPDGPKSVKGACAPVGFQIQESWT